MEKDNNNYNGCFQYATSRDRTWIHNDGFNNWAGVLFLTPDAPVSAGTGIYKFIDGTCTKQEAEARGNIGLISESSQDYTKWTLVDRIGNVFNRLVLFEARHFHASMDYFGTNKENGRLFPDILLLDRERICPLSIKKSYNYRLKTLIVVYKMKYPFIYLLRDDKYSDIDAFIEDNMNALEFSVQR